ncbi:MAG: hypothetical protein IKN96_07415 [Oscillibacter sp.]|nr:hypothetical protein [Oscillibacter sp.]
MNILNWISIFAANLSIGIIFILGIKYMLGQTEERAEYQKVFIPYIIASFCLFQISGWITILSRAPRNQKMSAMLLLIFSVFAILAPLLYVFARKTIFGFIEKLVRQMNTAYLSAEENAQRNYLITKLMMKKTEKNLITYSALPMSFAMEYVTYFRNPQISTFCVMVLTVALLICNFAYQQILYYRVKHGLYGTCYSEAKEIVSFILEWHRKNGDSNGKPPKLVFTQEEIDECLQANGGEEYAG